MRKAPGWNVRLQREGDRVAVVRWSGNRIPPNQYDSFQFIARNPVERGDARLEGDPALHGRDGPLDRPARQRNARRADHASPSPATPVDAINTECGSAGLRSETGAGASAPATAGRRRGGRGQRRAAADPRDRGAGGGLAALGTHACRDGAARPDMTTAVRAGTVLADVLAVLAPAARSRTAATRTSARCSARSGRAVPGLAGRGPQLRRPPAADQPHGQDRARARIRGRALRAPAGGRHRRGEQALARPTT